MTQILMLLVWLIVALILLLKQNQLQKQLYHLWGFNASLRMRVFEQELRQLEAPGIFIHEDTAQILAGIVLAFLTQEQKAELEKRTSRDAALTYLFGSSSSTNTLSALMLLPVLKVGC